MGMDPVAYNETYEVTIQVLGPVNTSDFEQFRLALQAFLNKFDPDQGGGKPSTWTPPHGFAPKPDRPLKPYLQVRVGRRGQRKGA